MPDPLQTERCDVCIVGTGAAGGILAYRLAMAGLSVLSLEQGSPIDDSYFTNELTPEQDPHFGIVADMPWPVEAKDHYLYGNPQAHALYAREDETSTAARSHQVFVNRQIFRLNGKMNLWGGTSLRYSPRDFLGKQYGDSDTNWPIRYEDLAPHYTAVERLIGVCGTRERLDELPDGEFLPPLPLRPADHILLEAAKRIRDLPIRVIPNRKAVETRVEQVNRCPGCGDCANGCRTGSVYKFSSRLLPRIAGRTNYRLLCGLKVVRLLRDADTNRIHAAECLEVATGRPLRVEARTFVLCCGALETPRILFNSRDQAFPEGLANSSGLVGCYLQDNIKAILGASLVPLLGTRKRYELGSSDALLIPRFVFSHPGFRGGYQAQYCHFLPRQPYYLDSIRRVPGWLKPHIARLVFRSLVALFFFGKPEAVRGNRVFPSQCCDKYGIPQVEAEYAFHQNDLRMRESMIRDGRRILRRCHGVMISVFTDPRPGPSIHYAGTCRMASFHEGGVVNEHLQCFDHPNLYLCDGSVIPEISEKNLTLTIMALADRLASILAAT
ncbi:MAG TPA: GMC family oxidoreductase [Candidatus Methylomirabilis sp.]|nr:GMC family oxidoreductase [Candidatus Methylomirabilis sp.]